MTQAELEEYARQRGMTLEELFKSCKPIFTTSARIPVEPLPWWSPPNEEEQALLDAGLLDPRHFSLETTHESYEFIPLRDLDGDILPFPVRRGLSCAIPNGEESSDRTKQFIQDFLVTWRNNKELRASKKK